MSKMRKYICTQACTWANRYWDEGVPCNISDPKIEPPEHCFELLEGEAPVKPRDDSKPKVVVTLSPIAKAGVVIADAQGQPRSVLEEGDANTEISEQAEVQRVTEAVNGAPAAAHMLE